jgi:hypothetical protein
MCQRKQRVVIQEGNASFKNSIRSIPAASFFDGFQHLLGDFGCSVALVWNGTTTLRPPFA